MNFENVRKIDNYIRKRNTGRSKDFAEKVGISRGMLYRYLRFMKAELGAPIAYNKIHQTYQYIELGKLCINGWETRSVKMHGDTFANENPISINFLNGGQKP